MQTLAEPASQTRAGGADFDVIVVGAGFAGLYMLHRLRGLGFSVRVLEAAGGVGGTWYWNRYPGARCDVESVEYSYQFSEELQQEWNWSERYAAQPELLRYADHVADRFDLRRDIAFNTRVTAATFDPAANSWIIDTADGPRFSASYCVMATGCLSVPNEPKFEGTDLFAGPTYHTGRWPHEGVDFTGQRVGIIGTGSSAVQSIPLIAEQAEHLYVFQRTPSFVVPARNAPLDPREQAAVKAEYPALRALAKTRRNGLFCETRNVSALAVGEEEKDPATAEALCPRTVVGGKRLCIDTGYYETFNRPNVTLVDLNKAPLQEITRDGLIAGGKAYRLDAIVYAIGFDAMTGALTRIDIRGIGGARLAHKWAEGPRTYLGLSVAGFPNLFTITGPGSPSVLTNMLPTIEQHVDWIADCLGAMRRRNVRRVEATQAAEDAWVARVNEIAAGTLFPTANSWYMGANIPGKPRVFMPFIGFPPYVEICNEVAANGYSGFALS